MWRSQTVTPPVTPPLAPPPGPGGSGVKTEVVIGVSVAGFIMALASLFICLFFNNRSRKRKGSVVMPERVVSPDVHQPSSNVPSTSPSGTNSYDFSGSKSWFTYNELVRITGGFSAGNVIGEGGFGKVYMGALGDGRRVAVKQLKVGSGQGDKEFRAEVDIISRIHHRHLVTLVGYCVNENHRLLVYEFVPNDTLEHHLHGELNISLLFHITTFSRSNNVSAKCKMSNVMRRERASGDGLAEADEDCDRSSAWTDLPARRLYMAPEYASSGKLTDRSDVFSFGVVLLELITGRKPVDSSQPLGEESLVEWARVLLMDALETDDFKEVADPALECRYSKTEMRRMVEAAAACVRHSAAKRPRMVQVWRSLDVDDTSSDLTNGVKLGQSIAYDSSRYSADIELFRRMAFADDVSTAEFGCSDEDDGHSSSAGSRRRK
ncbi:hypothetical protein PR202_gb05415 [Eleusine coracana subsp. coracana]|uniref:non-specific serine/threonine protein kinase n=1 Tax=Eleusine coracana subsp. coracana TaxID=191504 RepID=A0AAV5E643_ELECO|nr:hypothetical protein PR202_gb05415 [Eleusine coracana subsp. coracana]